MMISNRIIERIPDEAVRTMLYERLKADTPIFFTRHQREIPNFDNVFEGDGVKIVVEPRERQKEYMDHRVLELYDDLDPNLNAFTEKLLSISPELAIEYLNRILTQYDAKEVYEYLKNAKMLNKLYDYAELQPIQSVCDKENPVLIQTQMFFLKGEFKSFGCVIQTPEVETTTTMIYDGSEDYAAALNHFKNTAPSRFAYLFEIMQAEGAPKNLKNEME